MSKHTPGPWILDAPGATRIGSGFTVKARTVEGPGFPTPSATGFYVLAEPPPHGRDKAGEQEANARLIAAAPDLLAALRNLLPDAEAGAKAFGYEPTPLIAARAAIAKAEAA